MSKACCMMREQRCMRVEDIYALIRCTAGQFTAAPKVRDIQSCFGRSILSAQQNGRVLALGVESRVRCNGA